MIGYSKFLAFAEYRSCLEGQFRCASGHCIDSAFVCDGNKDCMDTSDERNCSTRYPRGRYCPANKFQCDNTVSWMLSGVKCLRLLVMSWEPCLLNSWVWVGMSNNFRFASPANGGVMVMMTVETIQMRFRKSARRSSVLRRQDSAAITSSAFLGGVFVIKWTTVEMGLMRIIMSCVGHSGTLAT